MKPYKSNQSNRRYYTINYNIPQGQIRLVDATGTQLGLMERDVALALAKEREEDLVLIASHATPPVVKMIDFKKFLYQEDKKQKEAKKGIKKSTVKDIKISLFIAEGDLARLEHKAKEFLEEGNQIRINLGLKGREMGKRDMGIALVKQFITTLGDVNISKEPRLEGRVIRSVVARKK